MIITIIYAYHSSSKKIHKMMFNCSKATPRIVRLLIQYLQKLMKFTMKSGIMTKIIHFALPGS